jgi:hypothetical protein
VTDADEQRPHAVARAEDGADALALVDERVEAPAFWAGSSNVPMSRLLPTPTPGTSSVIAT